MKVNKMFKDLIPDGYFRQYLDLMDEMNSEMPLPFHFLAIATAVGNGIGFKSWAWLDRGQEVYPHLNTILFSPAGYCRRGGGTKIAMAIAAEAGLNVMEGAMTPEGLIDELIERSQIDGGGCGNLVLYVEELSTLLGKRDYQRPIIPMLTKLMTNNGGSLDFRTRTGGRRSVPKANLSCLFTTAPEWFMTSIPEEAYSGGFMSRFIPCYLEQREVFHVNPNPDPAELESDRVKKKLLAAGLKELIANFPKGSIFMTPEAAGDFVTWYDESERQIPLDERLRPSATRKPAHILRLALVLAAAKGEGEICAERLEQAIKLMDWYMATLWHMYGYNEDFVNQVKKLDVKVVEALRKRGNEALHGELMRACYKYFGDKRKMQAHMEAMEEQQIVTRINRPGYPLDYKAWPPRAWKLVGGPSV